MLVYFLFEICTLMVFGLLLFRKRTGRAECNNLMGTVLLLFVIMMSRFTEPYMFSTQHWRLFGFMDIFLRLGSLLCNPMLALYYILLATGRIKRWQYGVVLGPPLLLWLIIAVTYFNLSYAEQRDFIYSEFLLIGDMPDTSVLRFYDSICGVWYLGMIRIYSLLLFVYCMHLLFVYEKRLKNYFADITGKEVGLDKVALVSISLFIICLLVPTFDKSIMTLAQNIGMYKITVSIGSFLPLILFWLAAYRNRYTAADFVADAHGRSVLNRKFMALCPLGPQELTELEERIIKVVYNEKMYTMPNLTVDDVASKLHVDRKCVVKCIGRKNGLSFSILIRLYRIRYAHDILKANPQATAEQVAQMCGFVSEKSYLKACRILDNPTMRQTRERQCRESSF